MKPVLSIVIPALNEDAGIGATLQPLHPLRTRGVELMLADGGSSDATTALARPWVDAMVDAPRGRALQMNAGAALARADVLLFLHAETRLPPLADVLVLQVRQGAGGGACWGRFDVRIAGRPWMLRVVSWLMNLRSRLSGIVTGDQAIFVTREAFEQVGGFPVQPLMEDIEISRRLKRLGPPACLRARVCTSGRRWEQCGVWRTIVLMWHLRWRYWRKPALRRLPSACCNTRWLRPRRRMSDPSNCAPLRMPRIPRCRPPQPDMAPCCPSKAPAISACACSAHWRAA